MVIVFTDEELIDDKKVVMHLVVKVSTLVVHSFLVIRVQGC